MALRTPTLSFARRFLRSPATLTALTALVVLVGGTAVETRAADDDAVAGAETAPGVVSVIVKLDEEPAATYRGGIRGLAATSPAATGAYRFDARAAGVLSYRAHLAARHASFARAARAAIPAARVLYEYDVVLGGLAMTVPADEVAALRALPGVVAVYQDELAHPHTDLTPAFIGAKAVWGKLGGQDDAGEGTIVGIIDTGIWPEHPSLSDPDPKGKPYTVPPGTRACEFTGGTNPGPGFTCNGKLIGAYRKMTAYDACTGCTHPVDDFSTARDADGHGTHTATTAAGNGVVQATLFDIARGKVSGIAPRAHVIAYRVCGEDGCLLADSVAAIQQAIVDGVDVINYSISGGTNPYDDPVELAFLDAVASGVFVATSAGNDGPTPNTVNHVGGWLVSTAASTDKKIYLSKVKLAAADGAKLKATGASLTPGIKTPTSFVLGSAVGDPTCESSAADGAFTGQIVGCFRGGSGRARKSYNVAQRGAVGMLLFNAAGQPGQAGLFTDNHTVPAVHLEAADGLAIETFAAVHAGIVASFTQGKLGGTRADTIGAFSSRGGTAVTLGVLKPDIAAPGIQILAGNTPAGYLPEHVDGELFQAIHGTSMASPHIAGVGALLRQAHPDWSPAEIKSAIMTTAFTKKLVKEDRTTPFTPFDGGAGRVDAKKALTPGATFETTAADWTTHAADLWTVNQPSLYLPGTAPNAVTVDRTLTSDLAKDAVWTLSVVPAPGLVVTVPPTVAVPAGGSGTFAIAVDKSGLAPGAVAHATLLLAHKSFALHVPITAVGPVVLPNLVVTAASCSTPLSPGNDVTISRTVENLGTVGASRFQSTFYLSADTTISKDDVLFASCTRTSGLAAATASTCSGPVAFVPQVPVAPGTYHVLVVADGRGEVGESNELDGVFVVPDTVTVN